MNALRALTRALLVITLALSASQVLALIMPEPCDITESAGDADGQCTPTCVRCGCCAQPGEQARFDIAIHAIPVGASATVMTLDLLPSITRDILHVPKS